MIIVHWIVASIKTYFINRLGILITEDITFNTIFYITRIFSSINPRLFSGIKMIQIEAIARGTSFITQAIQIFLDPNNFGRNKMLMLTPRPIMGGINLSWTCTSNLEKDLISGLCKPIIGNHIEKIPDATLKKRQADTAKPDLRNHFLIRSKLVQVILDIAAIKMWVLE